MSNHKNEDDNQEWLTTPEAAEYLRVSVGQLRNMTSNGYVPYYKLGRSNRYLKEELKQMLLDKRRGPWWEYELTKCRTRNKS